MNSQQDGYHHENHAMIFESEVAQDVDQLFCPMCGRRILVQWAPYFQKIVLAEGNPSAIHTAANERRSMGSAYIFTEREKSLPDSDPQRLLDWETLLQKIDFEKLWREDA